MKRVPWKAKAVTDYPNQVHQLLVAPSRYLWFKKDGYLAYRRKPFGTTKRELEANAKKMLLRFVCRDHYTGAKISLPGFVPPWSVPLIMIPAV